MSRETENFLLLLVGLSIGIVTATGAYTNYVKPALLPWLAASSVMLVSLALVAIARDIRRGSAYEPEGHDHRHRSGLVWLLILPVALLAFLVPPPIAPDAVGTPVAQTPR